MKAVVVADGEPAPVDARHLSDADLIVAADGGAAWLAAQAVMPHLVVGDLDSIEARDLDRLQAAGIPIERHPVDKEQSDAELALARAVAAGADQVTLLGGLGGPRLDHELANLLMLANPAWRGVAVSVVRGGTTVRAIRGGEHLDLTGVSGDLVTLLPIGDVHGVVTEGLAYPLAGETLRVGESRGLSNAIAAELASVGLEVGTLLVVEVSREN